MLYGACQEAAKAALCLMLAWWMVPYRLHAMGADPWFSTQAFQELLGENNGIEEQWEYGLLAAYFATMVLHATTKRK